MRQGIRNFFDIFGKQGARQMLMAAVIFFTVFFAVPVCGTVAEGPVAGGCAVTNNNDAGPGSLRQCVTDA